MDQSVIVRPKDVNYDPDIPEEYRDAGNPRVSPVQNRFKDAEKLLCCRVR